MKRYMRYKDSGVNWIGEIPEHWGIEKSKHIFSIIADKSTSSKKVALENIQSFTGKYVPSDGTFDGDGVSAKVGDIVYGKLRPYLCKAWIAEWDCNAVGDFYVFRCHNAEFTRYIHYLFLSKPFTDICNASTYGAKMPRVSSSFILSNHIPIPPLPEQRHIVTYLDAKVTLIDRYISKREEEIARLKEWKQALISKAVTKGLDPNAKMKDSGIAWIGEVPEKWGITMLKRLLSQKMMYGANESAEYNNRLWPRYIRITDIDNEGKLKEETFKSLPIEKAKEYLLNKGDILFARSGATVGKTFIYDSTKPACFAGYLIKAVCGNRLNPYFLVYYTSSSCYDNWKNSIFVQSTIPNIGADKYSVMPLPIPPLPEQHTIVRYIEEKTTKADKLISKLSLQVDYLKEYKQRLISDVVTGKINVQPE